MHGGQDGERRGASASTADIPISAWEHLIDEWIFSERDRKILKRRMLDGLTHDELTQEFRLSKSQIKRILHHGMDALIKHI